jgi:deoxyribodipyrimidine photolyase-related protein
MALLRFLFIDQMSESISSLNGLSRSDTIMFFESLDDFKAVNHHKKKIGFLLSAMRHFAEELLEQGLNTVYFKLDDSDNSGDVESEIKKVIQARQITQLIVTEPSEYRQAQLIKSWAVKIWHRCRYPSRSSVSLQSL